MPGGRTIDRLCEGGVCVILFYTIKMFRSRPALLVTLTCLALSALTIEASLWLTEPPENSSNQSGRPAPKGTYLTAGKPYRHDTHEGVRAHVAALWVAYEREAAAISEMKLSGPHGLLLGTLPPDLLRQRIDGHLAMVRDSEFYPEDLPREQRSRFTEVICDCITAWHLTQSLEYCALIRASTPAQLAGDPSGYYEDREGAALCVIKTGNGYEVHAGAGRPPHQNSDHLDFVGELQGGEILPTRSAQTDERPAKLIIAPGMACLTGAGDRLDATFVRVGTLTPKGRALLKEFLPLGNEQCHNSQADAVETFEREGFVRFMTLPEPADFKLEAEAIVGYRRK
jgi:hypothetical protein